MFKQVLPLLTSWYDQSTPPQKHAEQQKTATINRHGWRYPYLGHSADQGHPGLLRYPGLSRGHYEAKRQFLYRHLSRVVGGDYGDCSGRYRVLQDKSVADHETSSEFSIESNVTSHGISTLVLE